MSSLSLRRLVSVTAMAAMALAVLPASSAFAQPRDIQEFACPDGEVPDPGFSDDNGNFAEDAIHCIVWYGVAQGRTSTTYAPKMVVNRGQMATFIANLLTAGGVELPADPEDHFDDDDGTEHEPRINQLAELGVVTGFDDGEYKASRPVLRDQMASFLARAYQEITGAELPEGEDAFDDDDGNFHEDNINRVATAGVAAGTGGSNYDPKGTVLRDQMALFIARELDLLVEEGWVTVPREAGDNPTALDVPELLRVERASATTVRFVFDEALTSAVTDAAFGLYSYDANRTEASTTSRVGSDTVLATFTEEAVSNATLGAVAEGAVQDADANTSSEGHAALEDVELREGTTAAPDLLAVAVRENQADFTFDEAAFSLDPEGYHLVLADGTVKDSTAVPSGDESEKHTVTFALTAEEAAAVAYGYVDDGTVSDEADDGNPTNGPEGTLNVLQSADVSETGRTNRPDLTEVRLVNSTTVRYVFDENVTRVTGNPIEGDPGDFRVYFTDGSDATAESSERTANNTITATFAEGTVNEFVSGAIVDPGTVEGTNGTNQAQELGLPLVFEAGDTAAPELVSAVISDREADGSVDRVVRYVFDDEVNAIVDGSAFKVYAKDGSSKSFAAASQFPPSAGHCTIDSQNAKVVECVVNDGDDEELFTFLGTAVVAAVERGAVESDGGFENAEGAAVLSGSVS